jgi:S-layer protein (TIGR01567 family)
MNLAISAIASGSFLLLLIMNSTCTFDEMRSGIYNLSQKEVVLDGAAFSGFYDDIDDNSGTEVLTLRLQNVAPNGASAILSDQPDSKGERGITYTVDADPVDFSFDRWGQYYEIYYLGDDYFAAYDYKATENMNDSGQSIPLLYELSKNSNLMANEQLSLILLDDDDEETINYTTPLNLEEGYHLAIKTVDADGKKVQVELSKDGNAVDNKVIRISDENPNISDETYYYKKDLGSTKDIVIIAVHFEHILSSYNEGLVAIDRIFQISDHPISLDKSGTNVNPLDMSITIDNKDRQITVHKNQDQVLIGNLHIKTSNQDVIDAQHPLRYYVYKKYNDSGSYVHSSVANLSLNQFTWSSATFPGFYYDINNDISTEQLSFSLSNVSPDRATLSDQLDANGLRGLVYVSKAADKNFKFKSWGQYNVIGFLGEPYFAAYDGTVNQYMIRNNQSYAYLHENSKNANLMTNEQISRVLVDADDEITINSDTPLKLEEGYQLAIKSADVKGNKVQLYLSKNGTEVDTKIIQPSIDNADMGDQTYYYKSDLGETKEIVQLAVHFKNAFAGSNSSIATVDGIFQISDKLVSLKPGQQYDKMSIRQIDPNALTITMDNKNNQLILSPNQDIPLMGGISIYAADQDEISDAEPLRYYLYKYVNVEGASLVSEETAPDMVQASEVQESSHQDITQAKENRQENTPARVETSETDAARR